MIIKIREISDFDGVPELWHWFDTKAFGITAAPREEVMKEWREFTLITTTNLESVRKKTDKSDSNLTHVPVLSLEVEGDNPRKRLAAEYGHIFIMNDDGKTIERI